MRNLIQLFSKNMLPCRRSENGGSNAPPPPLQRRLRLIGRLLGGRCGICHPNFNAGSQNIQLACAGWASSSRGGILRPTLDVRCVASTKTTCMFLGARTSRPRSIGTSAFFALSHGWMPIRPLQGSNKPFSIFCRRFASLPVLACGAAPLLWRLPSGHSDALDVKGFSRAVSLLSGSPCSSPTCCPFTAAVPPPSGLRECRNN